MHDGYNFMVFACCDSMVLQSTARTNTGNGDGALNSELRHTNGIQKRINDTENLREIWLNREQFYNLKTASAFWPSAHRFIVTNQLAIAILTAHIEVKKLLGEFYCNHKGNRLLALEREQNVSRSYDFIIDRG